MTLLKKRKLDEKIKVVNEFNSDYSIGSESDISDDFDENDSDTEVKKDNTKLKISKTGSEPKAKKPKNDLLKAPTVEELNQLRETENLFNSNLFRLQIVEMLNEVKIKPKYVKLFKIWYEEFTTLISALKDKKSEHELSDQSWMDNFNINFPMCKNTRETKGVFQFFKPTAVHIIGSYSLDITVGPNINIDISIEMPSKSFQKMDYLNQRYHRKRASYLCYLANKLQKCTIIEKIEFANKGNILKPILKITPASNLNKHVSIYLHISCQQDSFKLNRFNPAKNNVRQIWYFGNNSEDAENDAPTPIYNFTVLEDLTMIQNEKLRSTIFGKYQNMKDGMILLEIWLKQRELDIGCKGFTSYIMSMYMIYLIQQRKLNNAMSSYQIIRNVWNNLSKSTWNEHGISLCSTPAIDPQPSLFEFDSLYDVVFVDSTGYMNICAQMSLDVYLRIRSESEKAVKLLDDTKMNSFHALFMQSMPFYRQCDHIIQIKKKVLEKLINKHGSVKSKLNYCEDLHSQGLEIILDILRKGLGERVISLVPKLEPIRTWPVSEQFELSKQHIMIGLIMNPNEALNVLHKGPGANLPEAEEFRKFWGSKSELRRFQDGSISEACVWGKSGDTMSARRNICREIVLYLLRTNLSIASENVKYISGQMENILKLLTVRPADFEYGTGEEASLKVIQAFDSLSKDLRNLTDLPLEITALQGISPVFRYSDVFPALGLLHKSGNKLTKEGPNNILLEEASATMTPVYVSANEAVIQLGLSGKWPENLAALRRLKAAFYIQIANSLAKTYQIKTQANSDCLDILKDGFVFRLKVVHQKEIGLMKQQITSDGVTKYRDTEESLEMERNLILMPKLTSALHGLHQQYSAYGPTVCLAKRWLSSQLLDDFHIAPQFVEFLVASLFLNPDPYIAPVQPQAAFVRFLNLVGNSDWTTTPVIINFNSEMTREQILETETHFNANRTTLPPLYIVTPFDTNSSVWSKISPSIQVLVRIALLARQSLELIENIYTKNTSLDFKLIFTPSLSGYDLVINLRNLHVPKRFYSLTNYNCSESDCKKADELKILPKYEKMENEKIPVTAYDPVQCYLKELRDAYDEFALFFYDTYGGDFIAVMWKPQALERKDFKVSHLNGRKVETIDGKPTLRSNLGAIIEDFYILGQGLVKSIENLTNKDST